MMGSWYPSISRALAVLVFTVVLGGCNPPVNPRTKVNVLDRGGGVVTVPVTLASLRPVVELALIRPDGGARRALAWVNMGAPAPILSSALYRDLGIDRGHPLAIRIGDVRITVAASAVVDGPGDLDGRDLFSLLFAPRAVEAVLPASVLSHFQTVLDPAARTLTLAPPGTLKPIGTPVPVRVDPTTGVATVEARVPEVTVPLVLDCGAPYTWLRGHMVSDWVRAHPDWYREDGAVGRSNLAMADLGLERRGTVIRLPELSVGETTLRDVGALGTGPLLGRAGEAVLGEVFWDAWQKGAGGPVVGWLGNNVLGDFRLTVDYAAGMTYWHRQRPTDAHDLDGVGLTLARDGDGYMVAAVAERNGERLVRGAESGDRLVAVDGLPLEGMSPDRALATLSGKPGERRGLNLLDACGRRNVEAIVSPF